jgi:hypothetical protein
LVAKTRKAGEIGIAMKTLLLATLVILTGCATSSHKVIGQLRPPIPPDMVQVYATMPSNAEVVSLISADSFKGVDLNQANDDALAKLKAQAGKLGANGVVIDGTISQKPLQGARLSGNAIYVPPPVK